MIQTLKLSPLFGPGPGKEPPPVSLEPVDLVYNEFKIFRAEQTKFNAALLKTVQSIERRISRREVSTSRDDDGAELSFRERLISRPWFPYLFMFTVFVMYESGVIPQLVNYFTKASH